MRSSWRSACSPKVRRPLQGRSRRSFSLANGDRKLILAHTTFGRTVTYYWHSLDVGDEGRWTLRDGHALELVSPGVNGKGSRQTIMIDRVVHETLYVRVQYQREFEKEVWLKQYGP